MPYLNCPQCRLVLYTAGDSPAPDSCPRCEAALYEAPRSMFPLSPSTGHSDPDGSHSLVRRALVGTGLFRDGTQSTGDRPTRAS